MTDNKNTSSPKQRNPWVWVPTLYFYQGMPYAIAMLTSVVMFKSLGIDGASIAFWTSLIYLPWAIKFAWSPFIDTTSTKRNWVISTQMLLGFSFIVLAFALQLPIFFAVSIAVLFVIAFSSASHDIAADGFYMLGLDQHGQSLFVGIRATFYRLAMLSAMGLIPIIAGYIESNTGLKPVTVDVQTVSGEISPTIYPDSIQLAAQPGELKIQLFPQHVKLPLYNEKTKNDSTLVYVTLTAAPAKDEKVVVNLKLAKGSKDISLASGARFEFTKSNWNKPQRSVFKVDHKLKQEITSTYKATAGNTPFAWAIAMSSLGVLLLLLALYHKIILPKPEIPGVEKVKQGLSAFKEVFVSFFSKPAMIPSLIFFLIYRLGEGQLVKVVPMFFLDPVEKGGLGLTTAQYGLAYGITAPVFLTLGGISGGLVAAKFGLKKMIFPMSLIMSSPILVYLYLSNFQPEALHWSIFGSIALEQFGYGFGFTAYMLYMLYYVGESKYKTAEFAMATSLMALGMMLPGMISGKVQQLLGYQHFFIYVIICAIPGMFIAKFLKIDPHFGIKKKED
jgi:MFS transporter, PAT family, beta-lactamase induction signal transducer AmpG